MFLFCSLLLLPSPQEEDNASHDGCNGNDTSNNTSNYGAGII
jgi:hypothetical protein